MPHKSVDGHSSKRLPPVKNTSQHGNDLNKLHEKSLSLIEKIQAAVIVHDCNSNIIACNTKSQELLGLTKEQLLGKSAVDPNWKFVRSDGNPLSSDEYPVNQVLVTQKSIRNMAVGVIRPDHNDLMWVLVHAGPLFDSNGKIDQVIVTFMDITERRRTEELLRASEARYRELYESNPNPMWVYDLESLSFLSVNQAAISHYGYSREEFLSMTIKDIRPQEDVNRLLENIETVEDGLDNAGVWRHIKKNGSLIDVEITSHVIDFDDCRAEMVLVHDITDRLRMEKEREEMNAQMLHSQKMESIGRLAGGIAHDFNNMLCTIMGSVELAMQETDDTSSVHTNLREIYNAATRSADLTTHLLAFARKQVIRPKVIDLNSLIAASLTIIKRLIGEHIKLVWKPSNDLWRVRIDPTQIDQILTNLCINSRDAIAGVGKITIETQNIAPDDINLAETPKSEPGNYVKIAVSDNGCGIDAKLQKKIFEPFFTTKDVGKGSGLGLSTVIGIVEQNHGFVAVSSQLGKGALFEVYIPRTEQPITNTKDTIQKKGLEGTETILIVEDEMSVLMMAKAMLERYGYCVLTASTPKKAMAIVKESGEKIDLLITDVIMPEMNGDALQREISKYIPQLKVLYMSGYTTDAVNYQFNELSSIRFIQKPFSINVLADRVRSVLDLPISNGIR